MYEMLDDIVELIETSPVALARVVETTGAGPRSVGASMVVTDAGRPLGSLSAGCVESVVIDTALDVIRTGEAAFERFGFADPDSIDIGLSCGGRVEVFIERIDASHRDLLTRLINARDAQRTFAVLTVFGPDPRWCFVGDVQESGPPTWIECLEAAMWLPRARTRSSTVQTAIVYSFTRIGRHRG